MREKNAYIKTYREKTRLFVLNYNGKFATSIKMQSKLAIKNWTPTAIVKKEAFNLFKSFDKKWTWTWINAI
jgi:hypothetical protein